jgi:Zn-dependent peptidase ImmA (M78 family)
MKYTNEQVVKLIEDYQSGKAVKEIAAELNVPERSVIAKLSSLGVYKRKEYLNKRGEVPIKKEEYIERIATLLDINVELLESLEKVTKSALVLIERQVRELNK